MIIVELSPKKAIRNRTATQFAWKKQTEIKRKID